MANRVQPLEEQIYCKLPEGMDGHGGYKADILVDNLSEREINLFVCRICHGIKREACFWEHRERPDISLHDGEIKKEIDSVKVSCPIKIQGDCEWTGKLSEFEVHVRAYYGNEERAKIIPDNKTKDMPDFKAFLSLFCFCLFPSACIAIFTGLLTTYFIFPPMMNGVYEELSEYNTNSLDKYKSLTSKKLFSELDIQIDSIDEQLAKITTLLVTSQNQLAIIGDLKLQSLQTEFANYRNAINRLTRNAIDNSITKKELLSIQDSLNQKQFNPYNPQGGVTWTVYNIDSILEFPVEITGPEFYVKEYKFQPILESLREHKDCLTFCITLVDCDHYDKIKWPMELEEKGFQISIRTALNKEGNLEFEMNEDTRNYFKKPINEKNKPLCKEWICKKKLMKFVVDNQMKVLIKNKKLLDN